MGRMIQPLLLVLLALVPAAALWQHCEHAPRQAARADAALPKRVLWVWERPEELGTMPAADGIAVLEQTIRLGARAEVIPRRQPFTAPRGVSRIAVVRMEATAGFAAHRDDAELFKATVESLQRTAWQPGIAALQIDFDAKRSERAFYRRLLMRLRPRMPAALPLNITALASWCSTDDWIAGLPVQEATPMFFRMEPDRRRVLATAPEYRIREPLCAGSVGVSTRERWPGDVAGKRVFVFADRGWAEDLPLLEPSLARVREPVR